MFFVLSHIDEKYRFSVLSVSLSLLMLFGSSFGEVQLKDEPNEQILGIVGGNQATQGQFPYAAALYYNGQFICTASIISKSAVMTAARCVVFDGNTASAASFRAVVGNVNRSSSTAQQIDFSKVTPHPDYDEQKIQNDLAILKTTVDMVLSETTQPICIADSNFENLSSDPVTAMGWGRTDRRNATSASETLRYTQMRVIPNSICRLPYFGENIPKSKLCAMGFFSGVCSGDSGSPLVYDMESTSQQVQVGVASYVNAIAGCGTFGPSVFMRVSSYTDFIMNNTEGNVCVA